MDECISRYNQHTQMDIYYDAYEAIKDELIQFLEETDDIMIEGDYAVMYSNKVFVYYGLLGLFSPYIEAPQDKIESILQNFMEKHKCILGSIWNFLIGKKYCVIMYNVDGEIVKKFGYESQPKIYILETDYDYYLLKFY